MESLRSATRNTAFERWLATAMDPSRPALQGTASAGVPAASLGQAASIGASPSRVNGSTLGAEASAAPCSPADSADSAVPVAEGGLRVQRGRVARSRGQSHSGATAASLAEVAHYLVPAPADDTADSQPAQASVAPPLLPAERAAPGNAQGRVATNDTGSFRPGWRVCNSCFNFVTPLQF